MVNPNERDVLLFEIASEVRRAHGIASGLLDRQQPRPTARGLIQIALALRNAIGMIDAEQQVHREPVPTLPMPLDAAGFAKMIRNDARLPVRLRIAAEQALSMQGRAVASPARVLLEIAEHVNATVATLGCSTEHAVARCTEVREWSGYSVGALLRAIKLHDAALFSLGERP